MTTAIKSIFSVIKENVEKTEYQEGIGDETTTYNVKNSYTDHLFFLLLSGKNKDEIVKKIIGNYVVRPNPDDYKDDLAAYIKASKKFEEENPYFFVNEDQGNLYFKSIRDDVAPGAAVKTISDAVDTFLKQLQEIKMS